MPRLAIAIAAILLVYAMTTIGQAQPRCVFLECGPGNKPNPQPAVAPIIANAAPIAKGGINHAKRPRSRKETCSLIQGFDYCASSVLKPQYGNTYGPDHLVDEDLRTAWVEGKRGQGEGEYVVVDLGKPHQVNGIQIMNGYHKNVRLFRANSRVRGLRLTFSDGSRRNVTLKDEAGVQTIEFPSLETRWVQFEIRSVYKGTKYKDTAVTELRVLTSNTD